MAMHPHGHADGQGHDQEPTTYDRAFAIGVTLNLGFVAVEALFGLLTGSLALLADAGHNLSDVLGLLIAWGAAWLSRLQATPRRTYGYRRSTILASLANAIVLLIAVGAIVWEALRRVAAPEPVESGTVMLVAAIGIVINTVTALLFMRGRKGDINIKGAFLHMAADAAVSAGVVIAALLIGITGWFWLDPAVSLAIAVVITVGTWGLLRDSLDLALDAVPGGIDQDEVRDYLTRLSGVDDVHDLHIWAMSTTETALTAHLVRPELTADDGFLAQAADGLKERFDIGHVTLQVESGQGTHPCELASERMVKGGSGCVGQDIQRMLANDNDWEMTNEPP